MGPKPKEPLLPCRLKQFLLVGTPCWQTSGILLHPVSTHSMMIITISMMPIVSGLRRSLLRRMIIILISDV
jgi:hypothetical protein